MNSFLKQILGLHVLPRFRQKIFSKGEPLWENALQELQVKLNVVGLENWNQVKNKPLILLVNHPHGLLDAVMTAAIFEKIFKRDDYRLMMNQIVSQILPELAPHIIGVNNMGWTKQERDRVNKSAIASCENYLLSGGVLGVCPAGSVSQFRIMSPEGSFKVTDADWRWTIVRLWKNTQADILPFHISGKNSLHFRLLSIFGNSIKRLLSFWEFMMIRPREITITLGAPLTLQSFESDKLRNKQLTELDWLRKKLFSLGDKKSGGLKNEYNF